MVELIFVSTLMLMFLLAYAGPEIRAEVFTNLKGYIMTVLNDPFGYVLVHTLLFLIIIAMSLRLMFRR